MIISTLSAFILAVLVLLIMENIKNSNRGTTQNIKSEDKEVSKI